ncbi:hypothetical protein [Streptomyces sp. V1I6]|uniref:hypothetical protein n=1 Tax=Streptomyces sp. V1I6 TaxID=3042273 RepID=UPI0027866AB7|nr:hypothetical protein [Streptomyces sp. V1I6]MDQ0847469.1 hypothetical protein [Streptomyces sp. V1I6]
MAGFQQRVDRGVPGSDAIGEPLAPPWRARLLLGRRRWFGLHLAIGDQDAKALTVAGDRYIIWRNRHADDRRLRAVVDGANVA